MTSRRLRSSGRSTRATGRRRRPEPVRPREPRRSAAPAPQTRRRGGAAGEDWQVTTAQPESPAIGPASSRAGGVARWSGEFLFLVFFIAVVIMVVAVVLVGAVGQWWVLVPVMLADFAATFAVIVAIVQLLGADG